MDLDLDFGTFTPVACMALLFVIGLIVVIMLDITPERGCVKMLNDTPSGVKSLKCS